MASVADKAIEFLRARLAEAITAYSDLVERIVARTNNRAYEEACRLIERTRIVRENLGQGAAHAAYLADLTSRHKAKRNFMKLLRAQAGDVSAPR